MADIHLGEVLNLASVERVRTMLGDRPDAIVTVVDPEGRMLFGSEPGSVEMFGRTPDMYEDTFVWDYIHESDASHVRRQYDRALEGEAVRYTVRAIAADGSWHPVTCVSWSVDGPLGRVLVIITTPAHEDE